MWVTAVRVESLVLPRARWLPTRGLSLEHSEACGPNPEHPPPWQGSSLLELGTTPSVLRNRANLPRFREKCLISISHPRSLLGGLLQHGPQDSPVLPSQS